MLINRRRSDSKGRLRVVVVAMIKVTLVVKVIMEMIVELMVVDDSGDRGYEVHDEDAGGDRKDPIMTVRK